MPHYFRNARLTACGKTDFRVVTLYIREVTCPRCREALTRKFGIRFNSPEPKPIKEPELPFKSISRSQRKS